MFYVAPSASTHGKATISCFFSVNRCWLHKTIYMSMKSDFTWWFWASNCHKFLMVSNQMSHCKNKCIRIKCNIFWEIPNLHSATVAMWRIIKLPKLRECLPVVLSPGLCRLKNVIIDNKGHKVKNISKWAVTCDFQQCGILPSVDSDKSTKCRLRQVYAASF